MWFSSKTKREYVIRPKFTLPSDYEVVNDRTDVTRDLKIVAEITQKLEAVTVKRKVIKKNDIFVHAQQIFYVIIAMIFCLFDIRYVVFQSLRIVLLLVIVIIWANCASSLARIERSNKLVTTMGLRAIKSVNNKVAVEELKELLKNDTLSFLRAVRKR